MAFREAQATVDRWISQYREGYFAPLAILARLTEEVIDLDQAFDKMMAKVTTRDADRWTRRER